MKVAPVKMFTERLNIVGELDGYASEMIRELAPKIYKWTDYNPITLAQKGDLLLVNSGAKTSFLNLKKIEKPSEIEETIWKNVRENSALNITGRSIEYIG